MTIGIDARFYGPRVGGGGIGRYVEELVKHLELLDRENGYVIFLRRENWDDYVPTNQNFRKVLAPWRWYTAAEQLRMPRLIRKEKLDLLHVPHFNIPLFSRVPLIVTIHDLILFEHPSIRASTLSPIRFWMKYVGFRLILRTALRRARRIITVSEATRQAIQKRFSHLPNDRLTVIHPGFTPLEDEKKQNREQGSDSREPNPYNLTPHSYLLTVGNSYPHKNLDSLLRAFRDIMESNPELKLVLVGPDDDFRSRLRTLAEELNIADAVLFTGFVDDATLATLYRNALLYLVPSLLEGFALPGLEAQSHGAAVLASDITAHREVFADSTLYFDPRSITSMVQTVNSAIGDERLRGELRRRSLQNYQRFSWEKTARETAALYRAILENLPRP